MEEAEKYAFQKWREIFAGKASGNGVARPTTSEVDQESRVATNSIAATSTTAKSGASVERSTPEPNGAEGPTSTTTRLEPTWQVWA